MNKYCLVQMKIIRENINNFIFKYSTYINILGCFPPLGACALFGCFLQLNNRAIQSSAVIKTTKLPSNLRKLASKFMTAHCKPNNCIMKGEQLADRGGQTLNSGAAQCHWATALKIASESNQHLWAQVSAENTGTSWKTRSTAVLKKPQGQGTKT